MSDHTEIASLTREEAGARAELLDVRRYDIDVDMTGLLEGDTLRTVSTVTFGCRAPGSSTFVDCVATVHTATLNGVPLAPEAQHDGRIRLDELLAENVLVVVASQSETSSAAGIQRTVDPSDGLVYVWTSFEPDDARRCWACFDQPDLKAPHAFTVTAPASWTVASNSAVSSAVDDAGAQARTWSFPDTPPLSTYVVVVNAGPFHEIRSHRGGHDLGLLCRRSLSQFLERDAEELFALTAAGLAFFGERFGAPFAQERYDQVFVPNLGGAMENWGCVTWSDSAVYRSEPSHQQRADRAEVLLHEMAHMWFGDLVTMRWWDDLWLNEAFASWAATWACAAATEFTDAWAGFLASSKMLAYRADMAASSHPIRQPVPDVAGAMASFDAITYLKGCSVLKQLVAYVGEDAFVEGLRAYFARFAWSNTTLDDLMEAIGEASGRDLSGWTIGWLDQAGTDHLSLERDATGWVLLATGPGGSAPRPHRLDIGAYRRGASGWEAAGVAEVETVDGTTPLPQLPDGELYLVNDTDLTFASARPDAASRDQMLASAGDLPTPMARAMSIATAWDMLVKGEVTSADFVACASGVLRVESSVGVVEEFLGLAVMAAEQWTPASGVAVLQQQVADTAATMVGRDEVRRQALRTLARTATDAAHLEVLRTASADDVDLAWRLAARLAELGEYDADGVDVLLGRDPDPDAWVRALAVRAARPDAVAKDEVWRAVFVDRSVPSGGMREVAVAFWRPSQAELLRPWTDRYLDEMKQMHGSLLTIGAVSGSMYPFVAADAEFVTRAEATAADPQVIPYICSMLRERTETLQMMLRARTS